MNLHTGYQKLKVKEYNLEKEKTEREDGNRYSHIGKNKKKWKRRKKRKKCQKERGVYCRKSANCLAFGNIHLIFSSSTRCSWVIEWSRDSLLDYFQYLAISYRKQGDKLGQFLLYLEAGKCVLLMSHVSITCICAVLDHKTMSWHGYCKIS